MNNSVVRIYEGPEKLDEMYAHEGHCRYCNGIVKMWRTKETGRLMPQHCSCIMCGQRYFMEIDDIEAWEIEQWRQKHEKNT